MGDQSLDLTGVINLRGLLTVEKLNLMEARSALYHNNPKY